MKTKVLLFITLLFSFCGFAQETTDATIDKGSGILYFSAKPGTTPSSPDLYSVSEFAMNTAANPPELWVWNRANTAWERQFAITQGTAVPTVAPATGLPRTYIRTTTGAIYVYNGSSWVELGTGGGGGGTDDQTAVEVPFSPIGNILSSDVQSMGEELQTQIDAIQTTSGVVNGATNLGTFSGSTISDNTTTKAALQELETAVESGGGSVPNCDYFISDLADSQISTIQSFFNTAGQNGGRICFDEDLTIGFANNEKIELNYDFVIEGNGHSINVPQEPIDGVVYKVFEKANNIDLTVNNLTVTGAKDGTVDYTANYTLSGTTVTLDAAIVDNTDCGNDLCDEGRYIYLDGGRALITSTNSTTEVEIDDAIGVSASGTATIKRSNQNYFLYTGGSDVPTVHNITLAEGKKYIVSSSSPTQENVRGYIYLTIDEQEYERRIQSVSNDTLYFSSALPDEISTLPTTALIGKFSEVTFNNCNISGEFENLIYFANQGSNGGDSRLIINGGTYSSGTTVVGFFMQDEAKNSEVYVNGALIRETGIATNGDGNGHPTDPNGIGFYLHPHVSGYFDNTRFIGNYRDHIKWFSSGDSQTSIQKYGAVTNCYFESQVPSSENIPYDIILNGRGIVDVVNSHGDGRLRLKSSANISNSSFAETEINQVRDGAIININNFVTNQFLGTTGASISNNYNVNISNITISNSGENVIGLRTQGGEWKINNSTISVNGLNVVAVQNQGGDLKITDSEISASHTSGNFFAVNLNSTSYTTDRDLQLIDNIITNGSISLSNSGGTDKALFRSNDYAPSEGTFRNLSAIEELIIDRLETSKPSIAEVGIGAREVKFRKSLNKIYTLDVTGMTNNTVTDVRVYNEATTGLSSIGELRDEFKIDFLSDCTFQSGVFFATEESFSTGDFVVVRWDNTLNTWYIYEDGRLSGGGGSEFIDLSEPYVYLFRLRGQSNARGQGLNTNLNASDLDAFSNVFIWNNSNTDFEALDIGTNNEGAVLTEHGLEAGLARRLEANYSNQNFYILKTAIGGREINNMLPSASSDVSSVYVKDSLQSIAAINNLISEGKIPVLIDVFIQGESDADNDNEAYLYADKFKTYYHNSNRYDINTPIVIAEIGGFNSSREIINDAHAYASSVYENTFLIKSANYPRLSAGDSHFNYLGLDSIAIELYDLIKSGLVKGSPIYRDVPLEKPINPGDGAIEYAAITDFATTEGYTLPSSAQQTAQQAFISQLKSDGVWDNIDGIYVFRTDGDSDFAKINWKNPVSGEMLTQTGTVSFTTDTGFTGDGSTGYLSVPVSIFSNYTGADAGFISEVVIANTTQGAGAVVGLSSGSNGTILSTNTFGNNIFSRVNSSSNFNVASSGNTTGLFHWSRTDASTVNLYRNGALFSAVNHGGTSITSEMLLMQHNGTFFNTQLGIVIIGSNLGDLADEIDAAYDTYKASL